MARIVFILSLILFEIGCIFVFYVNKYGARSWRNGMDWNCYRDIVFYHLLTWFNRKKMPRVIYYTWYIALYSFL